MPNDDYEPQVLALMERCAVALEQIAKNTAPTAHTVANPNDLLLNPEPRTTA